MRQRLTLDPRRTALVLVDLQEEQRDHPLYAVEGFEAVLGNARRILEACRNNGLLIAHSAYRRDFTAVPKRPLEYVSANGGPAFSDKDSPRTAICGEVAPKPGETVIWKNEASAFCEGDLAPLLRRADTERIIVCGVWTEACVAATVRDAIAEGIRVLLVKDACGSGTMAMHQTGVINLANRLAGGAVADTAATLRLIDGAEAEVWVAERPVPILFGYDDAEKLYQSL
ncbi:isochorismatase family protein [Dongia sedimenti]|uniref:Isochorismatase family protein n=1 Tax=Dongia sedimenti TaxID=3064282 RepID=A0ABU0YRU0_9PROT|nr:isochorismatase family protein [Rhodospirillaceae bacterium R-7]